MKKFYLLAVVILLMASCKKDDNSDPVNPDKLRVYTASSYYDNGNLRALNRYSYDEYGMLTKEVVFYVGDSLQEDTTNVARTVFEYVRENDSILTVLYYLESSATGNKDTTRWLLNDKGLCIRAYKSYRAEEGLTRYALFTRSYDQEGYCTVERSISYITDSISDTSAVINTNYRTILNGNCIKTTQGMLIHDYTHYPDLVNTLNYGNQFFGKSDENPIHKSLWGNSGWIMSYDYLDGKIDKVSYSYQSAKGIINDSTILVSVAWPHTTYFKYVEFR